jgi:hypothetical protein
MIEPGKHLCPTAANLHICQAIPKLKILPKNRGSWMVHDELAKKYPVASSENLSEMGFVASRENLLEIVLSFLRGVVEFALR